MTVVGILLSVCTGSLRAWRKEKFSCREGSTESYVLTRGNGHKHVFVVRGAERGLGLVLDDLAGAVPKASKKSRLLCGLSAFLWIAFLITAGGLDDQTWYLLGVGTVGMIHNAFVAGKRRSPESHGMPLSELREPILGKATVEGRRPKIMEILYQVEEKYPGVGLAVLPEFFQDSSLREEEVKNWAAYQIRLDCIKAQGQVEREARRARSSGSTS